MNKKCILAFVMVLALVGGLISVGCAPKPAPSPPPALAPAPSPANVVTLVLSIAEGYVGQKELIYTEAASRFAELIDERSNGRIKIKLYGSGELYPDKIGMAAACMAGELGMWYGDIAPAISNQGVPESDIVFRFPYVGYDVRTKVGHVMKFLKEPEGAKFLKLMKDKGLVLLDVTPFCPTGLGLETKAMSEADFSKLKVRVTGGVAEIAVKCLGATPVPMAWGEVSMGLKTGVVDGLFSDIMSYNDAALWSVGATYWVKNFAPWISMCGLMVSTKVWEKLPADVRDIIEAVNREFDPWTDERSYALIKAVEEKAGKNATIYELPADFVKSVQGKLEATAYASFEKIDPEIFAGMKRVVSGK